MQTSAWAPADNSRGPLSILSPKPGTPGGKGISRMTQTLRFNVATFMGLLLMFAGAWIVFGLGVALLAFGTMTWLTAMFALNIATSRAKAG